MWQLTVIIAWYTRAPILTILNNKILTRVVIYEQPFCNNRNLHISAEFRSTKNQVKFADFEIRPTKHWRWAPNSLNIDDKIKRKLYNKINMCSNEELRKSMRERAREYRALMLNNKTVDFCIHWMKMCLLLHSYVKKNWA